MTYEQFVKSFNKARKKGDSREPMSEDQFNEMMGLDKREEKTAPKVVKTKQPTLGLNIIDSHKIRISKPDKPDAKPKRSYVKRDADWKRSAKTNRVMVAPKISYKGMSVEEIKAHKAKLAREWRARTPEKKHTKKYSEMTDDEKKALSIQKKKYYQDNKERLRQKARDKRSKETPEQKQANTIRMQKWREKVKEELASA